MEARLHLGSQGSVNTLLKDQFTKRFGERGEVVESPLGNGEIRGALLEVGERQVGGYRQIVRELAEA